MPVTLGSISTVPLRDVWPHEAHDFTPWLRSEIGILGQAVGIEFDAENVGTELPAGTFSADMVADARDGRTVVIENQFGKSDHDHLGKLITYLVAFEADCAIWVVEEARPEHIAAVTWLNQQGSLDAYLVKVQAIRIGDSVPAPLFTRIVGPDEETKILGQQKQELRERHLLRHAFWQQLIPVAAAHGTLPPTTTAGYRNWLGAGAGVTGLGYYYVLTRGGTRAELYIDRGDPGLSKRIYEHFYAHKETIEQDVGRSISWQPLEGKQACRIAILHEDGGYASPEAEWSRLINTLVDSMTRLRRALQPYLATVPKG